MAWSSIGNHERLFIAKGVEQNVRNDGRQRLDYRAFSLQTNVIPHASGSARFKLDHTDVLVAVNTELGQPDTDAPDSGKLVFSVECAPSASADYQGYGAQDLNVQLTSSLERMLTSSGTIDLQQLCIVSGKQCWTLYIDALILDCGGNLLDALSIATKAALADTKLSKVNIIAGENEGDYEVEVSEDPYDSIPFPHQHLPIFVTLSKIGGAFAVDLTQEEEQCVSAHFTVAVNQLGQICGIEKSGVGGVSEAALSDLLLNAKNVSSMIFTQLDQSIQQAQQSS